MEIRRAFDTKRNKCCRTEDRSSTQSSEIAFWNPQDVMAGRACATCHIAYQVRGDRL